MISIENISLVRAGQNLLTEINYDFHEGHIYGLVGNNGSGKTVLMKCILGFMRPDKGTIKISGEKIGIDIDFPDDAGIIIETPGFFPELSGYKNLMHLASMQNKIHAQDVKETMIKVGLDPESSKKVSKYSLVMRQRLGIAQAIMEKPNLLILDEPFNGLDKEGIRDMRQLIAEYKSKDRIIILSSHNETDINTLCDTVLEMDGGVLQEKV